MRPFDMSKPRSKTRFARTLGVSTTVALLLMSFNTAAQIQFQDVSNTATDMITSESWGISAGDYNGDGWPDIFVTNHRNRPTLYRNNGDGTFDDVLLRADVDNQVSSNRQIDHHVGTFADVDNDGDDDLVSRQLTRSNPAGTPQDWHRRLFYSDNGEISLSGSRQSSGDEWSAEIDCNSGHPDWVWPQLGDLDGDNVLDYDCVYLGRYESIAPAFYNHADIAIEDFDGDLRQEILAIRGGSFIADAKLVSPTRMEAFLEYHRTNGRARATFDAQPPVDFIVHHKGTKQVITLNGTEPQMANGGYFQVNTVDIRYEAGTGEWEVIGKEITSTFFWDQYKTAYIVAEAASGVSNVQVFDLLPQSLPMRPRVMDWDGAQWKNRTWTFGLREDIYCVGVVAGDFDNDKDLDLYVTCRGGVENIRNRLYANNGQGVFTEVLNFGGEGPVGVGLPSRVGTSDTAISLDYNNDGYLDIAFTNGKLVQPVRVGGPMTLLKNTGSGNRWVTLDLVGSAPNFSALGARVVATSGGTQQMRFQNGGFHRFSQNDNRIHFGLGSDSIVDLEITWPDNSVEVFNNVSSNSLYTVTQGQGIAARVPGNVPQFPAPQSGDECGTPSFLADIDVELFVYRVDCTSDTYTVRAGGGSFGAVYTGSITANAGSSLNNIQGFSIEANDTFIAASNRIDFNFNMGTNGLDGFSFDSSDGDFCIVLTAPNKAEIVLGGNHNFAGTAVNLSTFGSCGGGNPTPQLSIQDITVNENVGAADINITLSSAATGTVTTNISTTAQTATGGTDFYGFFSNVTFTPGQTSQTVSVQIVDDATPETTESFQVRLFGATGASVATPTATVTIEDDDSGALSVSATPTSVNESLGTVQVVIELSAPASQAVSVAVSTRTLAPQSGWATKGSDFYGIFEVVSFAAGETSKTVNVTLVNDSAAEPTEVFDVRLFNANGVTVSQQFTTITILDDD